MKHRILPLLVPSLIATAICLAQTGCSQPPAGQTAASNTSAPVASVADNANSAAQPASEAAPEQQAAANPTPGEATTPAAPAAAPPDGPPPPPPPPRTYTLAAGRQILIFTTSPLSTKTSKAGDFFVGTLANAIVDNDWVIARKGATVEGVVSNSDPGGKVKGVASLTLVVKRLELADGSKIELPTSSFTKRAKATKKKDAAKIGGGAAGGALIGAIIGGKKGAAIGAGVGGGAGTAVVMTTRGDPATIPAETRLTFRLRSPVTVTQR
jgi:hypothetical protein